MYKTNYFYFHTYTM